MTIPLILEAPGYDVQHQINKLIVQINAAFANGGGTTDPNLFNGGIGFSFNSNPTALTAGIVTAVLRATYNGTITGAYMNADQSGSAVVHITKNGTSIYASDPPTLSSQQNSSDTTLTGWTTSFVIGDLFVATLASASIITTLGVQLATTKS